MELVAYRGIPNISTMIDELFGNGFNARDRDLTQAVFPSVDIAEDKDSYHLRADMPGLKREDIDISVKDGVLTLSGEKKQEVEKTEKNRFYHFERTYGKFSRSFTLSENVDPTNIKARLRDGVLEIDLAKTERAKPSKIAIQIE